MKMKLFLLLVIVFHIGSTTPVGNGTEIERYYSLSSVLLRPALPPPIEVLEGHQLTYLFQVEERHPLMHSFDRYRLGFRLL